MEALLRRHHDRLYALCRRLAGNDADAADACQEALMAIVRGIDRFDGRARFSTWAYRVTTNACLDELRRRRRRPDPKDLSGDDHVAYLNTAPDAAAGVADRMDVDTALASLAHDFRVAVVLRDQCGLSYDEIAEVLGVPVGTVRSRISRGRGSVADHLGPTYGHGRPDPAREPGRVVGASKGTAPRQEPRRGDPAGAERTTGLPQAGDDQPMTTHSTEDPR